MVGDPPKRIGASEWPSADQAQAYLKSPERAALNAQRDKAFKISRQFIVERPNWRSRCRTVAKREWAVLPGRPPAVVTSSEKAHPRAISARHEPEAIELDLMNCPAPCKVQLAF